MMMMMVVVVVLVVMVICSVDFKWTNFGLWHFALSYMCPVVSCFWIPWAEITSSRPSTLLYLTFDGASDLRTRELAVAGTTRRYMAVGGVPASALVRRATSAVNRSAGPHHTVFNWSDAPICHVAPFDCSSSAFIRVTLQLLILCQTRLATKRKTKFDTFVEY